MDSQPVQSGSKCSSDFSIERILSSECSSSDSVAVPEWLCCTRYRPPRIQRTGSSGGCRGRRAGRHARVPFTGAQAAALEAAYARAPYLAPPALRALAAALQLRDDRIKIWFQNRRARERREKSGSIAPPAAVTLPPTNPGFTQSQWLFERELLPIHCTQAIKEPATLQTQERVHRIESFPSHSQCSLRDITDDERPETPLDIESVED